MTLAWEIPGNHLSAWRSGKTRRQPVRTKFSRGHQPPDEILRLPLSKNACLDCSKEASMNWPDWWVRAIGRSPLRRYFWTAAGIVSAPRERMTAGTARDSAVIRFQEFQPGGGPRAAEDTAVSYVAELAPGKIIGDVRFAATHDDVVIGNLQLLHGVADPAGHWSLKQLRFRRPRKLSGTALLLAPSAGENYFHWLCDSLPRLRLLELAGVELKTVDWFLLTQSRPAFQDQSLDLLGIPAEKRYRGSKARVLTVQRLIVPSMTDKPGVCPAWACEYLRKKFLPPANGGAERKIYISRGQARRRKLVNEEQVLPWLEKRGFEIVCLERLNFAEQVKLFSSARIVAGVHGAGMTNLIFGPPGCSMLEFFSPDYHQFCYRDLAATLKMKYRFFTGNPGPHHVKRGEEADI